MHEDVERAGLIPALVQLTEKRMARKRLTTLSCQGNQSLFEEGALEAVRCRFVPSSP